VPHYSSRAAYSNFGHKRYFDENAIDTITKNKMTDLSSKKQFKLLKKKVIRSRFCKWRKKEIIWILKK